MRYRFSFARLLAAVTLLLPGVAAAATLDEVKGRGVLVCGVNEGLSASPRGTRPVSGPASTRISAAPCGHDHGVYSHNIRQALASQKPEVRRLVGLEGDFGEQLGLDNDWAVNMVRAVGNYGEVFDRSLGFGSDLHIPRGMKQLWHLGGIQYAPPIR